MILDANEQAAYAIPGVLLSFSSASFTLVAYEWIVFAGEALTSGTVSAETLLSGRIESETLEPI